MTDHERHVLAAMGILLDAKELPAKRNAIARRISNTSTVQKRTMKRLLAESYVKPESWDVYRHVEQEICRCGSDRWLLTPKGIEEARNARAWFAISRAAGVEERKKKPKHAGGVSPVVQVP